MTRDFSCRGEPGLVLLSLFCLPEIASTHGGPQRSTAGHSQLQRMPGTSATLPLVSSVLLGSPEIRSPSPVLAASDQKKVCPLCSCKFAQTPSCRYFFCDSSLFLSLLSVPCRGYSKRQKATHTERGKTCDARAKTTSFLKSLRTAHLADQCHDLLQSRCVVSVLSFYWHV